MAIFPIHELKHAPGPSSSHVLSMRFPDDTGELSYKNQVSPTCSSTLFPLTFFAQKLSD
jgi:hypothetical protein